jgi:hypothetical protein
LEIDGSPNPFQELALYMVSALGNWKSERAKGRQAFAQLVAREAGQQLPPAVTIFQSPEFSADQLPIPVMRKAFSVFAVLGKYFELVQFPAFVELQKAQVNESVPEYLPNSQETIEGSPPRLRTWQQWRDQTHEHRETGDAYLVPLNSFTAGNDVAGSLLVRLLADGYTVKPMQAWPPHPVEGI